jgi:hypothetical protein
MISLPVLLETDSLTDLFSSLRGNQAWEWDPAQGSYTTVTSLQPGRGYWVALDDPSPQDVLGEPLDFMHLTLQPGWNLIGAPFDIGSMQTLPADTPVNPVLELNETTGTYQEAQTLRGTKAYWIWAHADCELILYSADSSNPPELNKSAHNPNAGASSPPPDDLTGIESDPSGPGTFRVRQTYPNPFNPSTVLTYTLAREGRVEITVHDLQGKRVNRLYRGHQSAGEHQIRWDGCDATGTSVPSGLYWIRVKTRDRIETIKAMRIK